MMFVAYDVCRIMMFVANYDVCRLYCLSQYLFLIYIWAHPCFIANPSPGEGSWSGSMRRDRAWGYGWVIFNSSWRGRIFNHGPTTSDSLRAISVSVSPGDWRQLKRCGGAALHQCCSNGGPWEPLPRSWSRKMERDLHTGSSSDQKVGTGTGSDRLRKTGCIYKLYVKALIVEPAECFSCQPFLLSWFEGLAMVFWTHDK